MAWLEITVNTAPETIDKVCAALTAGGFDDLLIEDQQEFEAFLDQNKAYWDYIDEDLQEKLQGLSQIKLYLEDTQEKELEKLQTLVKELGLTAKVETMPETDWETSWRDNYPPVPVGEKLVVLPYWLSDTETNRLKVILDPGLTFGTGAHPTTQMVVEAMEENVVPGAATLDLGSGSGILSIAALRLGAKLAVGVDIDPKAEDIARENAAYNGFADPQFTALTGNVLSDKKLMEKLLQQHWDLVLVNIVADVIISLSPVLPRLMDKNSRLILSGILDVRLADVEQAIRRAGLTVKKVRAKEEWRCLEVVL